MSLSNMEKYIDYFSALHTNTQKGVKAPHKAVMLLSVIDLVEYQLQFVACQVASILLDLLQSYIAEWVFRHQSALETHRGYTLKDTHQLLGRVGLQVVIDLQIGFKVEHKIPIDERYGDIWSIAFHSQELFQTTKCQVELVECRLRNIHANKILLPIVELGEYRK